jgi:hypothetical protein
MSHERTTGVSSCRSAVMNPAAASTAAMPVITSPALKIAGCGAVLEPARWQIAVRDYNPDKKVR